jgi:hypothetical protein
MTALRKAAEKALEALLAHADIGINADKAIATLRTALEEPEQEPLCTAAMFDDAFLAKSGLRPDTKLYDTPPRREWQGLTDEEIGDLYVKWDSTAGVSMADFARATEATLKEKNR